MAHSEVYNRIERAILRRPSKNMAANLPPHAVGVPDFERAQLQHAALTHALRTAGVTNVSALSADTHFPDGSQVADMAVVTERVAILSNYHEEHPRQGEQRAAAAVLAGCRFLKFLTAPGCFDARDVLRVENNFFIALSDHTNREGAAQLAYHLKDFGYEASILDTDLPLRLAAAATWLGNDRLLIREEIAQNFAFLEYNKTIVRTENKAASGAVLINQSLLLPQGVPELRAELRMLDIPLIEVNVSEFEKIGAPLSALVLCLPEAEKISAVLQPNLQTRRSA